nr:zinc finger, CCHC-type [Tanacetum cinerariifolium]
MAFVSTPSTSNNDDVSTVFRVSTASLQVSTANLSDATVYAFLANQSNGAKRFFQKTGKKITINGSDTAGYDKAKVKCFNCHKMRHFTRECRVTRNQENRTTNQETIKRTVNVEDTSSKAMVEIDGPDSKIAVLKSKLEKISKEKDDIEIKVKKFENASQSLDKLIGSQITDKSKRGLGYVSYNAVSPPHTRRFSPLRIDLSHTGLPEFAKPSVKSYRVKPIEELKAKDEVESPPEIERKTIEPSVDKVEVHIPKQNDKPARRPVKYAETYKTQSPRGNQRNWNNLKSHQLGSYFVMYNKACYACGSFNHFQARCKYHQKERMVNGTNHLRVNHSANTVPKAVLTRNGLKPVNTVRHVNPKLIEGPFKEEQHTIIETFPKKVNTAMAKVNTARLNSAVPNAVKANKGKAIKASACWVWRPIKLESASIVLKKHTFIDARGRSNRCSRHMTGNISYLTYFKEFDGAHVSFGEELKVMCDKKNSVFFIDTECFVLSSDFKLADESHVLLKVPRKNNMYSVDMKNIVLKKDLTCLVAKATNDELMLWHRRLGHINFKNISKVVKENLVKATKDETSRILKSFITEIENLVDKKLRIIRCDNRTEFKNRVMNEFCKEKGIKREYSVATTPQQNRVAERRNRTMIKAARTMVLVVKTHFKTLYELFRGTNSNDFAGKGASFDVGQSSMETGPSQDYILMPLWNDGSLFDYSSNDSYGDNKDNDGPCRRHIDLEYDRRDLLLEVHKERYSRSKLLFQNLQILFKVDFDQGFKVLRLSSFARVLGFIKVGIAKVNSTRLNIEKLDVNIVQKHGGSKHVGLKKLGSKQVGFKQLGHKQVGFKQLDLGVETGFHGVQDEKRVWFEVELHGAQEDREAEVFQVSNDDTSVAQRRLKDKQLEEKTNTDCLVKEQEKVDLGIKAGANITVTGVSDQKGAEDNVAEKKKVKEPMKANLRKLLKYKAWLTRRSPVRGSSIG